MLHNYTGQYSRYIPLTVRPTSASDSVEEETLPEEVDIMSLGEVDQMGVLRVIREINTSKSSGLENISSSVVKEAFGILVPEITHMYNLSIKSTKFPEAWKKALVVPKPKQGNLTKVQNFRPISLLPLPGKILEKLVHKQPVNHLESDKLLIEEPHGFHRGHSIVHSIAQFTGYVSKSLDMRLPTFATFIDFHKAFDCVQHSILIGKLAEINLDNNVFDWVRSYLSERKQRVLANGAYSTYQSVTQGVPQGSVLGPLFYLIYANDLAKVVKHCKIAIYADDTVLNVTHPDSEKAIQYMQEDLDSLSKWCSANNILANTEKTKVMVFGSCNSLNKLPAFEFKLDET